MYLKIALYLPLLHTPTPTKYNYLYSNASISFTITHSYYVKLRNNIYNHTINYIHNVLCTFTLSNTFPTYISKLSSKTHNSYSKLRNKIYIYPIPTQSSSYVFIKYMYLSTHITIVYIITYNYYSEECYGPFTYTINTYNIQCTFIKYIIISQQSKTCVTNNMYEYIVSLPTSLNRLQLPYLMSFTPSLSSLKSVHYKIRYHK